MTKIWVSKRRVAQDFNDHGNYRIVYIVRTYNNHNFSFGVGKKYLKTIKTNIMKIIFLDVII